MYTELTEEQIAEFKDAFSFIDKDKDGSITSEEIGSALEAMGKFVTPTEIRDMINLIDSDGNGKIEFSEFLENIKQKLGSGEWKNMVMEVFKGFDKDGNAFILEEELRQ